MPKNLPLHATREEAKHIAQRVEAALKQAAREAGFVYPELDELEVRREVANAAYYYANREFDAIIGVAQKVPMPPVDPEPEPIEVVPFVPRPPDDEGPFEARDDGQDGDHSTNGEPR